MEGLAKAAQGLGLKAEGIQTGREALPRIQLPAIAWYRGNHYVAVLELKGRPGDAGTAVIHDPNDPDTSVISQEILLRRSSGYLLLFHY
jgi:ABC-type bacteriocin/lantibiotic exporter with double-glycine peptidase domain